MTDYFFLADDPQNDYFVFLKKKKGLEPTLKKKNYTMILFIR